MKRITIVAIAALVAAGLSAQTNNAKWQDILQKIDDQSNFSSEDFKATVKITTQKPEEDVSINKITYYRRDKDDKFLLLILEPSAKRGEGYLKTNDKIYFYNKKERKLEEAKVDKRISDSNSQSGDFGARTYSSDYTVVSGKELKAGNDVYYQIELQAKDTSIEYDRVRLTVLKAGLLVIQEEQFAKNKARKDPLRTSRYSDYQNIKGKWIPFYMEIVDNVDKGSNTIVEISNVSYGKIPDDVFTQAYIESAAR